MRVSLVLLRHLVKGGRAVTLNHDTIVHRVVQLPEVPFRLIVLSEILGWPWPSSQSPVCASGKPDAC